MDILTPRLSAFITQSIRLGQDIGRKGSHFTLVVLLSAAWSLGISPTPTSAQTASPTEYQLKAAFLFKFARYTTWPSAQSAREVLTIGIIGDDPFGNTIDRELKGLAIHGREVRVIRESRIENMTTCCDIIFVSPSEKQEFDGILGRLKGAGVLTVGDTPRFAHRGGIINFTVVKDQLRFEINVTAAEEAGLKISSKLLRFAQIVETDK